MTRNRAQHASIVEEPVHCHPEETKAKIASLGYIQNELNGIPNLV